MIGSYYKGPLNRAPCFWNSRKKQHKPLLFTNSLLVAALGHVRGVEALGEAVGITPLGGDHHVVPGLIPEIVASVGLARRHIRAYIYIYTDMYVRIIFIYMHIYIYVQIHLFYLTQTNKTQTILSSTPRHVVFDIICICIYVHTCRSIY